MRQSSLKRIVCIVLVSCFTHALLSEQSPCISQPVTAEQHPDSLSIAIEPKPSPAMPNLNPYPPPGTPDTTGVSARAKPEEVSFLKKRVFWGVVATMTTLIVIFAKGRKTTAGSQDLPYFPEPPER